MAKIIRLTEQDLNRLVRRVIRESNINELKTTTGQEWARKAYRDANDNDNEFGEKRAKQWMNMSQYVNPKVKKYFDDFKSKFKNEMNISSPNNRINRINILIHPLELPYGDTQGYCYMNIAEDGIKELAYSGDKSDTRHLRSLGDLKLYLDDDLVDQLVGVIEIAQKELRGEEI